MYRTDDDIIRNRGIASTAYRDLKASPLTELEWAIVVRAASFGYAHGFADGMMEPKEPPYANNTRKQVPTGRL